MANDLGPLAVLHNRSVPIALSALASDPGGDALNIRIVQEPSHGGLGWDGVNNQFIYYAVNGYAGPDTIQFIANDGELDSNFGTVSLNVTNQAPTAVGTGPIAVIHGQAVALALNALAADPDHDALTISIVQGPSHGSFDWDAETSQYLYHADNGYVGQDTLQFSANDGALDSNVATVTLDVTDQAPVMHAQTLSVAHGGSASGDILAGATDADGDTLQAELVTGPSHGTLQLSADGSYSYGANGVFSSADSFTVRAFDGVSYSEPITVSITITDDAYQAYHAQVTQANVDFGTATASALDSYQSTVTAQATAAQTQATGAYQSYLDTVASAYQDYAAQQASAYASYQDAMNAAGTTATAALDQAQAVYQTAIATAADALVAAQAAAEANYQQALADADTAYAGAVAPYQQARDQAYDACQQNPDDPDAQAAYQQAQADLDNATTAASAGQDAAAQGAQQTQDDALAAAAQQYDSQKQAAYAVFVAVATNSDANWATAAQQAWDNFQTQDSTTGTTFAAATAAAWDTYVAALAATQAALNAAVADAQAQCQTAFANAATNWQLAEQNAWTSYVNTLGAATPEAEAIAPPLPQVPDAAAPVLATGTRCDDPTTSQPLFGLSPINATPAGDTQPDGPAAAPVPTQPWYAAGWEQFAAWYASPAVQAALNNLDSGPAAVDSSSGGAPASGGFIHYTEAQIRAMQGLPPLPGPPVQRIGTAIEVEPSWLDWFGPPSFTPTTTGLDGTVYVQGPPVPLTQTVQDNASSFWQFQVQGFPERWNVWRELAAEFRAGAPAGNPGIPGAAYTGVPPLDLALGINRGVVNRVMWFLGSVMDPAGSFDEVMTGLNALARDDGTLTAAIINHHVTQFQQNFWGHLGEVLGGLAGDTLIFGAIPIARSVEIIPNRAWRAGVALTEAEAVATVRAGGDVIAVSRDAAQRIAALVGNGAPLHEMPHGPGQRPHYHPVVDGARAGGHVLY